jgi:hypothetical protein
MILLVSIAIGLGRRHRVPDLLQWLTARTGRLRSREQARDEFGAVRGQFEQRFEQQMLDDRLPTGCRITNAICGRTATIS